MKTPVQLTDVSSRTDLLLEVTTLDLADRLGVAVEDLRLGIRQRDRVRAWNGLLRVSWITQLLERRLKTRVVLEAP